VQKMSDTRRMLHVHPKQNLLYEETVHSKVPHIKQDKDPLLGMSTHLSEQPMHKTQMHACLYVHTYKFIIMHSHVRSILPLLNGVICKYLYIVHYIDHERWEKKPNKLYVGL